MFWLCSNISELAMTDAPVPEPLPEEDEPAPPPAEQPFPWDEEEPPAADDPDAPRERRDAFTEARKSAFLKALVKTGCILDACRLVGPSPRTIYRHQESDPRFRRHCQVALKMSGTPVELTAWERAVEGVEEQIAVGGQMVTRRRYSENLLRLLLQGANPAKYGPRPGFKRKRLLRYERKSMEREIRAEIAAETPESTFEDAIVELDRKLEHFGAREDQKRLANGWTKSPDGDWVPPGYAPIPGWQPPDPEGGGEEPPRDSV
jgi:hypothetical protein